MSTIENNKKLIRSKNMKNVICPNCGSKMAEILYGMPCSEVIDLIKNEEIFLGSCCIFDDEEMPEYHCYKCKRSYYKDLIKYDEEDEE